MRATYVSPAKINWLLRVTGRRSDGFHDLETIFQTISLHDTLTFEHAESLSVTCSDPAIPVDESNLVIRAARALGVSSVSIHIEKRIPAGGGLGGGSSNAATTLVALSRMFEVRNVDLAAIALELGSDVPFFLAGGTAYATGRGEELTPLTAVAGIPLLLLLPDERVMTGEAFRSLRRYSEPIGIERAREVARDLLGHQELLTNDFEVVIFEKLPRLGALKRELRDAGAVWSGMSGSGSTIVGAFRRSEERDAALARFSGVVRAEPAECVDAAP